MPKIRTLAVYPNPYLQIDQEGRPAGAVQVEPDLVRGNSSLRFVGAILKAVEIRAAEPKFGIEADHDHYFEFAPEQALVANTGYYQGLIKSGQLIAADRESWKAAGGAPADFEAPKVLLAKAKAAAIAEYVAHYGEEPEATVAHWADFLAAEKAPKRDATPVAEVK